MKINSISFSIVKHFSFSWHLPLSLLTKPDQEMTTKMQDEETGNAQENKLVYAFQNDFLALSKAFSLPEID
ncbi:hypothetical protein [Cedecea sp. MMO-103]|uniref:hypothetical protein n=1 Tax=Cedecea sp. MMO-103 TaxID=3081238 RepID=UPI00301A6FDA